MKPFQISHKHIFYKNKYIICKYNLNISISDYEWYEFFHRCPETFYAVAKMTEQLETEQKERGTQKMSKSTNNNNT